MKQPCELIVAKFLPAIRGELVRILLNEYGLKQTQVANAMGLTQAAVSHYYNSARGTDPELRERFPEIQDHARRIAEGVAKGSTEAQQAEQVCEACHDIRGTDKFCQYHHGTGKQTIAFGDVVRLNRRPPLGPIGT